MTLCQTGLLCPILDRRCVKSEKNVDLPVMWVDAPESMTQDECDGLAK